MRKTKKSRVSPLTAILISCGIILVILVSALFVGKSMFSNWLKGAGLQDLIRRKAESALHARVTLEDVKWEGSQAFVGKLSARGYPDAAFSSLEVNAVRANLSGVKDRAVTIPNIHISQVSAEFSNNRLKVEKASAEEETTSPSPELPAWARAYVPNRAEISEITIGSANLVIKDDKGEVPMSLREAKASIVPDLNLGVMEIKANGGKLLLKGAPELEILNSSLRFQGKNLFINDANLSLFGDGHISGQGEVTFQAPTGLDLEMKVSGVDVKKVVSENWQRKITGSARGPIKVSGTTEKPVVTGTLNLDNGVLEAIPVLEQIAKYTRNPKFNHLVLNQAQADFNLQGDVLKLKNIQIQSDGLTRVEGTLDKQGDSITGVLQIGVTPGTLSWIPGAEKGVFTQSRGGFLWTTMKIGGTAENISEDLTTRLVTAAAINIVENLPTSVSDQIKGIIGGQPAAPATATDPNAPNPQTPPANNPGKGQIGDAVKGVIGGEAGEAGKKIIKGLGGLLIR